MYTLEKTFTFEAAHYLPSHNGKCARMHGHSWKGTLILEGENLKSTTSDAGMLIDFYDISLIFKPILEEYLDHHLLNSTTELANPTSEELARWIFNRVKILLPMLVAVRIEETCTSRCTYRPNPSNPTT